MATSVLDLILRSRKRGDAARKTEKDLKGVEGQSKKTSRGLSKMGKAAKLAAIAGFAVLSAAAVKFAKDSVAAASAVEEMRSKFNVVFGAEAPRAIKQLEEFGEEVGRSRFQLMEMASTLQDTFVPLGFTRKAAADLSIELTKLATDVASFNNASDADVIRDFQSAIVGNHETVRKYGIVITEATLKQEAYSSGIAELGSELTNQQKVQARLNLITEGTSDAHGDAARTSESFANQSKALEAAIEELTVAVGEGLIPALSEAMPFFTEMVNRIGDAVAGSNQLHDDLDALGATLIRGAGPAMVEMADGTRVTVGEFIRLRQASRDSGAELRAIKSAGLTAAEGLDAVDDAQPTLDLSQPLDALANFTDAALGAAAVNAALREAMEDSRITAGELRDITMLAEEAGVELPENLREAASNFNQMQSQGIDPATASAEELGGVIRDDILGPTRELTEKEQVVRFRVEVTGDPIPGGGGGGGGGSGGGGGGGAGSGNPGISAQFGLDQTIPPGFPNDTFPVFASSGERVIVQTREQQRRGETVAGREAPGGNRPIIQHIRISNELEGRAFLQKMNRSLQRWA